MKYSGLFAITAALASSANATPVPQTVEITFEGAADAQFKQSFPTDGSVTHISMYYEANSIRTDELTSIANPLSISHIVGSHEGVDCAFNGIDNSYTEVDGAATVDVGPPQTQTSGHCWSTYHQRRTDGITVTFQGAAGAEFKQTFQPGQTADITNPLSISKIVGAAGADCAFIGVDNQVTEVDGAVTVDVGPPQTQKIGLCRSTASKRSQKAEITFEGAAGAQFKQSFPVGGAGEQISKLIS